jgi:hypothetical protein
VLAVANAVVDVLYDFFEGSVDKLPPESSTVQGEMPVLLLPGEHNDPLKLVFGSSSSCSRSMGAEQGEALLSPGRHSSRACSRRGEEMLQNMNAATAVLVRDDAAAGPIRQLVGDGALVLTVAEAKAVATGFLALAAETLLAVRGVPCGGAGFGPSPHELHAAGEQQ